MKIYFHNPFYATNFGNNLYSTITRQINYKKYWYLTQYLIKTGKAGIFVDLNQNSFDFVYKTGNRALIKLVSFMEFHAWMILNGINPFKVSIVYDINKLKDDDVLFVFAKVNLSSRVNSMPYLQGRKFLKIVHLTHYMVSTTAIAKNSFDAGVNYFLAETDLSKYPFFKKHFTSYNKKVYILPFAFQQRFVKKLVFDYRINRCLAIGSFHSLPDEKIFEDFKTFFKLSTYHPMRKAIFDAGDKLNGLIDSYVSHHSSEMGLKNTARASNKMQALYYKVWNHFHFKQSKYHSFNMVDKFNEYKMFLVPEEVSNLPGISFIEGMACGCAYVGINDDMYKDIGLKADYHYITYENNLESLIDKIKYYQSNASELSKIAARGHDFVLNNNNGERIAELFYRDLDKLSSIYRAGKYLSQNLEFECSFRIPAQGSKD